MANVNVTRTAVNRASHACVNAATALKSASKDMLRTYEEAGSGWSDAKYKEVGEIVKQCNEAMKAPISQLSSCYKTLETLSKIIEIYEEA